MTSIPCLSGILRQAFGVEANRLATETGVIQRQRVFSGASLLRLLVFGWLKNPQGGPSFLARFAGSLDLTVSKQAIEDRFTLLTATWLLAVLQRGVHQLVCARAVNLLVLQRFSAVLIEDGSTITLPAVLREIWRGCGGSGAVAALKLTVRWDLLRGGMSGPYLQDGRASETRSPLRLLSAEEALALLRARWQIELLGMLVQHWLLLLSCWDDPHRSLTGAAQVIRDQIPVLVHGLTGHLPLGQALRLITDALRGGCSIPRRQTRLSTSYRLLECSGGTVT
jgi:hypothetical protein